MRRFASMLTLVSLAVLSACGGGGGGTTHRAPRWARTGWKQSCPRIALPSTRHGAMRWRTGAALTRRIAFSAASKRKPSTRRWRR